jgi:tRNA threonylcarbamoyladenosine biosynthesis protein TsaB
VITLGFDTATPSTAVALKVEDATAIEARDDPALDERPRHTSDLLVLAERLLSEAQLRFSDLDAIAVGIGPGTFTGLRVGVASARGLSQSLRIPLIAVCSLRALAKPALIESEGRPVLAVLDARRGEVFLAAYECNDGALVELAAPAALAPEDLGATLAKLRAASADPHASLAVGDGACRFASQLQAAGANVPREDSPLHLLRAAAICDLARGEHPAESVEQVLPLYGRPPDAELAVEGTGSTVRAIEGAGR